MRSVVLALLLAVASPTFAQELLFTVAAERAGDGFGASVLALDDLDGDGLSDLAVGAAVRGQVWVFSGADGESLYTLRGDPGFGVTLAARGAELIVGTLGRSGGLDRRTFRAGDGRPTQEAAGREPDDAALARARQSWARALLGGQPSMDSAIAWPLGDLDGDGLPDRGTSSPFALPDRHSGLAWITLSSAAPPLKLRSGWRDDAFGWSLAAAGDVNGDGHDDIIVGAPGDDSGFTAAGAAYVFSGATSEVLFVIHGQAPGERLGSVVGSLGDVSGDGLSDVFVSALQDVSHGGGRGVVRVYSGSPPALARSSASAAALPGAATH